MVSAQRAGLIKVCKAYRSVPNDALPVIAGICPIILKIEERVLIFLHLEEHAADPRTRSEADIPAAIEHVRNDVLDKWQAEWDAGGTRRVTHAWIPNIRAWLRRPHGTTSYWLTQALRGMGSSMPSDTG
ncbi:uncharacterized protein LOC128889606 [Hylaeus anthracinus]|uniref:uncharacterized protein LOC128889606 n=1 Tax=Hylaeus anthracinus TaxID=313031 RepID=UPI0023B88B54|nr:uncharacterized protein LOC128889606 [Hylaeus anthracinus]